MPTHMTTSLKARIKHLAAEIDRWPSPKMIKTLIKEAHQAAAVDAELALPLTEIGQAAAQLLKRGRDADMSASRLEDAVGRLETVIRLRGFAERRN